MIGNILDKYHIIKKIGEGGMATVYQGRHTGLERDVAVKIIHPGLAQNKRNRQRFAREAKAIERLDHKNIVKIWDYSGDFGADEEHKPCYIITELVPGLNLSQLMEEQDEIPSEIVALIGIEVCEALAYAHSHGFIHRDIKPDNIMLRTDGAVKLLDFGIARFAEEDSLTLTKSLVGSPAYMSPEQATDEADGPLDHRSDLFSLGIVLFQLVTGELPYHGSNPSIVLKNIIDNRRAQAHGVAPHMSLMLSDCIESLLQTNRDIRLPDAQSVAQRLRQVWNETGLDMAEEQWSLRYWLSDPVSYKNRLHVHLKDVLLKKGRELTEQGKQLDAQRYLNRLLIIDPDNDEVFDLLQNMHNSVETDPRKQVPLWLYALPLLAVGSGLWFLRPQTAPVISVQISEPLSDQETIIELSDNPSIEKKTESEIKITQTVPIKTIPKQLPDLTKRPKKRFSAKKSIPLTQATERSNVDKQTETPEPTAVANGYLTVSIPNAWAEIWIEGVNYGRTGKIKPIELPVGEHEITLINPYSLPHVETIKISPKLSTHLEVRSLKRKPARLIFAASLSPECDVILDGSNVGELGVLKHQLTIDSPNLPHELQLDCPEYRYTKEIGQLTPGSSMPIRF